MEIRRIQNSPQSFRGYDARPLKGLVMRYTTGGKFFTETAEELAHAARKYNVDVFVQTPQTIIKRDFKSILDGPSFSPNSYNAFPQDVLTFTTNGKTLGNYISAKYNEKIGDFLNRPLENLKYHIQGGNYFIFKDGAKDSVLIGQDELQGYRPESILKDFNVAKIYAVSQPDFHLDLAIRPLKNKQVLVADDMLTLEKMAEGIRNVNDYLCTKNHQHIKQLRNLLNEVYQIHKAAVAESPYKSSKDIADELSRLGFEPIRVPGRVLRPQMDTDISDENHFMANYMNAVVHEKPDGTLAFLTNKSVLDSNIGITPEIEEKINFSFEKMFVDSIKDYVAPDDIHFISGGGFVPFNLDKAPGGLHCLTSEIPKI